MTAAIQNERLTVDAGERVRLRVLCSDAPALISLNDSNGLVHLFQDLNFSNVVAFIDTPPAQWRPRASGVASFPDRLAWVEATAASAVDYNTKIAENFEVTDVWDADKITPASGVPANGQPIAKAAPSVDDWRPDSYPSSTTILWNAGLSAGFGVIGKLWKLFKP